MNNVILLVAGPLLMAFLQPMLGRIHPVLMRFSGPVVLGVGLMLINEIWQAHNGQTALVALGGFDAPIGISFRVDELALLFLLLIQATGLLLWPWHRWSSASTYSLHLLLFAALNGMALSGDLFNLYVFYELAAVASFGLVSKSAKGSTSIALIRYLLLSSAGSVLALLGIALIYSQTGSLNLAQLASLAPSELHNPLGYGAFIAMLLGFGVKAELFPVNAWVSEVYASASHRISALLAGLVSKLSVLILLRLLIEIFPLSEIHSLMLALGTIGVISGEFAAWRAKDNERMLAYSSIAQLGLILVALGIPGPAGIFAALALLLHHLVVKTSLFMLAQRWSGSLSKMQGAAANAPLSALLYVLLGLSLLGIPPFPGFWAKLVLISGLLSQASVAANIVVLVILIATVVEAAYLIPIWQRLYGKAEGTTASAPHFQARLIPILGVLLLVAALLNLPLLSNQLREMSLGSAINVPLTQTQELPEPAA